jgi:osmotically-inducible protein OsmY
MLDSAFRKDGILKELRHFGLCLFLLACASLAFAHSPLQLPGGASTGDQNTPNTKPVHDNMSSKDVTEKLHKALDSKNAAYAGSNIEAVADDQTVTLSGTVTSSMQREMALQLARAYAGNRKIVDKLTIQ